MLYTQSRCAIARVTICINLMQSRLRVSTLPIARPLLTALLFSVFPAGADNANNALSIDQLVADVLTANPSIAAANAAFDAAHARANVAGALDDPQLLTAVAPDTIGGYGSPNGRGSNVRIEISQNLPWPGKLAQRESAATQDTLALSEQQNLVKIQLTAAAQSSYAQWYYVNHAVAINAQNTVLLDELRRVAEQRYASGLAQQQDVLQAEIELQHLQHQNVQLQSQVQSVKVQINTLLNRATTTPLPNIKTLPTPMMPALKESQQLALRQHPLLMQSYYQLAANKDREALAEKNFYPDFKVFTGYNSLWDADEKRWIVGVSINLPLGQDKYRSALDGARADAIRTQAEADEHRLRILDALERAWIQAEEAHHTIALYEDSLLPRTRENFSANRATYSSGGGDFSHLITASRLVLNAELSLIRAQADYVIAMAQLQLWAGGALPAPHQTTASAQPQNEVTATSNEASL